MRMIGNDNEDPSMTVLAASDDGTSLRKEPTSAHLMLRLIAE